MSSNHLEMLLKKLMDQYGIGEKTSGNKKGSGDKNKPPFPKLSPSQQLVILGLLGGVFEVQSVLIDKNQIVQIRIEGSLREKTQLEKIMDQVGAMPFDEVMKAIFDRY